MSVIHSRHRGLYALWIILVIGLGLGSRAEILDLSPFVAKYAGDALWALLIFLGFGFLLRTRRSVMLAGLAFGVCCAVEFSQLYHTPWLNELRRTWFGKLVMGDTFAWGDIVAYLVGIVLGASIEWATSSISSNEATR